jgi:hypothetical protein
MVAAVDEAGQIRIDPERARVRVRCAGALDDHAAVQLTEDCAGLIDRGFTGVILDMSQVTDITPAVVSAIAAVDRRARVRGCRFSVVPGIGDAADEEPDQPQHDGDDQHDPRLASKRRGA